MGNKKFCPDLSTILRARAHNSVVAKNLLIHQKFERAEFFAGSIREACPLKFVKIRNAF